MAEIDIEARTRSPLPWLLAAVVLVALLWFLFARNATDRVDAGMRADSTYRDTSAAGAVAPSADSAAQRRDITGAVPQR